MVVAHHCLRLELIRHFLDNSHGCHTLALLSGQCGAVGVIHRRHTATARDQFENVVLVEVSLIVRVQVVTVANPVHGVIFAPSDLVQRNWLLAALKHGAATQERLIDFNLVELVLMVHHVGLARHLLLENRHDFVSAFH